MIDFIASHSGLEMLQTLFPEIKELTVNPESLTEKRKGELIGQLIGKHGTDLLFFAGIGKGIKAFRQIKNANAALTLKSMAQSLENQVKLTEISQKWWQITSKEIEKLQQIDKGLDKALFRVFRDQHLTEHQTRKILHHAGYKTFPKPRSLPRDCRVTISKKNGGMRYIDPNNQQNFVRIMPGNPSSQNPFQRKPYVVQIRNGNALDIHGNILNSAKAIEAHIPIDKFHFSGWE